MSRLIPSVDTLAEETRAAAAGDAAARLHAAVETGRELTKIGDALVERFVVEARKDGLSWARIGELVGISRRAAQERYAVVSVLTGPWPGELAERFAGP